MPFFFFFFSKLTEVLYFCIFVLFLGSRMSIVSLKRLIAMKREIEVIERVRAKIAEEDRVFRTLLDYKNLYKAGLISEPEYTRRKEEEEEEE